MAEQNENETLTEEAAVTDDETATDETGAEVEGFNGINTTRDNIPRRPRPASAATMGGIGGAGASQIAIKEQGVK